MAVTSADQLRWLAFEPETVQLMGAAFDKVVEALRLTDKANPFRYIVAKKIIEVTRRGECDPDRLARNVLKDLGR